jgi:hypothetical protein
MKNSLRLVVLLSGCALLLFVAGLWLRSDILAPEEEQFTPPPPKAPQSARVEAPDQPASGLQSAPKPPASQPPLSVLRKEASEFERFNEWAARYEAAAEDQRRGLVDEGIKIAQVRRVALQRLIETDPRRAIENAVPPVRRQKLPAEVVERLEERVNEEAFYGVLGAVPSAERFDQLIKSGVPLLAQIAHGMGMTLGQFVQKWEEGDEQVLSRLRAEGNPSEMSD